MRGRAEQEGNHSNHRAHLFPKVTAKVRPALGPGWCPWDLGNQIFYGSSLLSAVWVLWIFSSSTCLFFIFFLLGPRSHPPHFCTACSSLPPPPICGGAFYRFALKLN